MAGAELETWFPQQSEWLQHATALLLEKSHLGDADIAELAVLAYLEANGKKIKTKSIPKGALDKDDEIPECWIEQISNLKGINALNAATKLEFKAGHLTIIYGENGAGKSGYVRLLKHASGSKFVEPLHSNVYSIEQPLQEAEVSYKRMGQSIVQQWSAKSGMIGELKDLHIFDSKCAQRYVDAAMESKYEPYFLRFLSELVQTADALKTIYADKKKSVGIAKLNVPAEIGNTEHANWYSKITYKTKSAQVDTNCSWEATDTVEMDSLSQNLAANPQKKYEEIQGQQLKIVNFKKRLLGKFTALNAIAPELIAARLAATEKRIAASEDAKKVLGGNFNGIGEASWIALWEAARGFSTANAYPAHEFPFIGKDAQCVLCLQPLQGEVAERMAAFEKYVSEGLEALAKEAEQLLTDTEAKVPQAPSHEELSAEISSLQLLQLDALQIFTTLTERRVLLLNKDTIKAPLDFDLLAMTEIFETAEKQLETQLEAQKLLLNPTGRAEQQTKLAELKARKWLSENKAQIQSEIRLAQRIQRLEKAVKIVNTSPLTSKKNELAESALTENLVKKFETERAALKANIPLEIQRETAAKGRIPFRRGLKGMKKQVPITEILSEGEHRITALASFLADVGGEKVRSPFIFDDPISSLDQTYEIATAKRLIELAKHRQVIVFTHRLSLLSHLRHEADEAKPKSVECDVIHIRSQGAEKGTPAYTSLTSHKAVAALSFIKNDYLSKASKAQAAGSHLELDMYMKGICSEMRDIVERLIEEELLQKTILRHRKTVMTGQLMNLHKIEQDDCTLLDGFMSKYSPFVHSNSGESPVALPEPKEVGEDIQALLDWHTGFKKRLAA